MPLAAYEYRPATPPVAEVPGLTQHYNQDRRASDASLWSLESFPDSIDVHARTPLDRSPIRHHGQKLLPKLRTQDHSLDPSMATRNPHRRAVSTGCEVPTPDTAIRVPNTWRSTTSPPERIPSPDPESAISACFSSTGDFSLDSPLTIVPGAGRRGLGHTRSISTSTLDHSSILRYGYPTARTQPGYLSNSFWSEAIFPNASTLVTPAPSVTTQPELYDLPLDLQFSQPDDAFMTINDYLRSPNPPIDLCRQVSNPLGRGMHNHFWWDIRNIRAWEGFNLDSVMSVPGFNDLLNIPIKQTAFPDPTSTLTAAHQLPETEASLVDAIRIFYAAKVTAALKVATPSQNHMAMRPCRDRDGPAFISNYQNDREKTLAGNGRGRVVGIVRSHCNWNSGMRVGNNIDKVRYLEALAALHRHMREHQTRYGFIITETELVCARAGADDVPYFGLLELSAPIETRVHGASDSSAASSTSASDSAYHSADDNLTVCTALWYLHMLAKEEPLPGQPSWRMNVGPPAALSRQRTLPAKDKWVPMPQKRETRDSKTVRGWVWPSDPWNKKREGGKIGGRR